MKPIGIPTLRIVNEDGTSIKDCPLNPLLEKWNNLKKESCKQFEKLGYANYRCLECSKCPEGSDFEIPKEDLQEYRNYLLKLDEYNKLHNPKLYKKLSLFKNDD